LGKDIVIWWDQKSQSWQAFTDECPHRLARLSEGRINQDGLLECPYHGWTFSGDGSCQHIPQQSQGGQAESSKRACVASWPTSECQGMLFVYVGNPDNAAKTKIPVVEPLEEGADDWVVMNTFRDVPYDALTLLENILDPSHVAYTHHRTVGNRKNAAPLELEVVTSGKQGFKGVWHPGDKLKQSDISTTFIAPGLIWHDINSEKARILTVVYATPIRKGECRLFARFPFKFASKLPSIFIKLRPRWYNHLGQNGVLEDDQIFLHYQERYLQAKGGSPNFAKAFYLPTKADSFVFELHQWVNNYNAEPFPGEAFSPAVAKEYLLERYYSHTIKCASCSKALANIQKLKFWSGVMAGVSLASYPLLSLFLDITSIPVLVLETVMPLAFGVAWWGLNRLQKQFYEGRVIPPRNLPEKVSAK
jgi:phenylpropionate dioxygenase-like ring-hydroxylating dioxygenase large terminal subunit